MLLASLLILLQGPSAPPPAAQEASPRAGQPIAVLSWNLENLYDRYDDPWRSDEITKPAFATEERLARLAAVLRRLDADVVCLQEVEHRFLLERFNRDFLDGLGYAVVLIEGNDDRGIDVALLSRLPIGPVSSYRHLRFRSEDGAEQRFRRDLLRVRIGPPLDADVYVVHLKAQSGGEAADAARLAEARAAAEILRAELARDPDYRALVAGDFNDIPDSPTLAAFRDLGLVDTCADSKAVSYNREPYLSRIDFILLTPALAGGRGPGRIHDEPAVAKASDHNPVAVTLRAAG